MTIQIFIGVLISISFQTLNHQSTGSLRRRVWEEGACCVFKCTLQVTDAQMQFMWRSVYCETRRSETLNTRKWTQCHVSLWNTQCIFLFIIKSQPLYHNYGFIFVYQAALLWYVIIYTARFITRVCMNLTHDSPGLQPKCPFPGCPKNSPCFHSKTRTVQMQKHCESLKR